MLAEHNVVRTNLDLPKTCELIGVAFNVTGIPTENGVGGVGQTAIELNFAKILRQKKTFDIGQETRFELAKRLGRTQPLQDSELPGELAKLGNNHDYSLDYELDDKAVDFIVQMLGSSLSGRTSVALGTKLLPLLVANYSDKLARIAPIMIGITASDEVANQRKQKAAIYKLQKEGGGEGEIPTIDEIAWARKSRLDRDVIKYESAYPDVVYTAENLVGSVHYLLDNSQERTGKETCQQIWAIMSDVVQRKPVLAPFLAKYMSE